MRVIQRKSPRCRIRPEVEAVEERVLLSPAGPRMAPTPRPAAFVAGRLVTVSDDSTPPPPLDLGAQGTLFPGSAVEPQLAVDPSNPRHLVAVWQQDRWSNSGARAIGSAVSFDGGAHWSRRVLPGLTATAGGPYTRASDPWVDFARGGATVFASALPFARPENPDASAVTVSRSTRGGRTWAPPATLVALPSASTQTDKESIATDPVNPRIIYAAWNQQSVPLKAVTGFSRSTDGGRTWEAPRTIYDPGLFAAATNQRLFTRPNGTVYNVFTDSRVTLLGGFVSTLSVQRSPDRGRTWLPPIAGPTLGGSPVVDPDNPLVPVRTPSTPSGAPVQWADVAMDGRTGTLYAVWQDARLDPAPILPVLGPGADRIAFARSTDGGATWSAPIRVNQTPAGLAPLDQQAFLPAVQVAADGTIAVTYYDFRNNTPAPGNNTPAPGARTDAWIVFCRPGADCTDAASWGGEVRLTDTSFDLGRAPRTTGGLTGGGYFLGDYTGLKAAGSDFLALFAVTRDNGATPVVFRRISSTLAAARRR